MFHNSRGTLSDVTDVVWYIGPKKNLAQR